MKFKALIFCIFFSSTANATFLVDYQGLEPESLKKQNVNRGVPDGYKIFTDKYKGVIYEIGQGIAGNVVTFGWDDQIKNAMSQIIPSDWVVYADEGFNSKSKVTWEADDVPWIDVLAILGNEYGVKYVVDWDQKVIQIENDIDFVETSLNEPTVMTDPGTGQSIFIYTQENKPSNQGYILINGELVPVVVGKY